MRKYFCDGCGKEVKEFQSGREVRYVQQPDQKRSTTATPHVIIHVTITPPGIDREHQNQFALCRSCIATVVLKGNLEMPPAKIIQRSAINDLFGTKGLQGLGAEITLD